ncbi:hypothetical protein EVAR_57204_1 [Eumeta japonica]|uniref:Uncharacterized protein n=1 Tax=Eumeta variegata TaxID=151549 RepID=A0A4C1Z0P1_EUMVA|nr:hypothetical protein EVAR_57204_1 [Eumeta japonica]
MSKNCFELKAAPTQIQDTKCLMMEKAPDHRRHVKPSVTNVLIAVLVTAVSSRRPAPGLRGHLEVPTPRTEIRTSWDSMPRQRSDRNLSQAMATHVAVDLCRLASPSSMGAASPLLWDSSSVGRCTRTDKLGLFFLVFSLRDEGDKKPKELPRTRVCGVCPIFTNQETPEATYWLAVVRNPNLSGL